MIEKHPVVGVGIGGQPRASRLLAGSDRPTPNFVSHTTPLTVFAELGAVGARALRVAAGGGAMLILQVPASDEALGLALGATFTRAVRARALLQRLPRGPAHLARARRSRAAYCGRSACDEAGGRRRVTQRAGLGAHAPCCSGSWRSRCPSSGSDPVALPPAERGPAGSARAARASGRRGVGRGHRARRGLRWPRSCAGPSRCYLLARRPPALPRWTGIALVLTVGASAHGALHPAPARPARLHRAVVLHERLHLPGRAGRRPGAAPRQPLRARLPRVRAGALLHARRQRLRARAREARWRSSTSPTSPARSSARRPGDLLPEPFDDYRLLVLFATLALLPAALLFRGPLGWRLALGAVLVCNPIAVRSAWFGQNDAPSLLLLVLAFALVTQAAIRLGRSGASRRDPAEAVRDRRAAVPRR